MLSSTASSQWRTDGLAVCQWCTRRLGTTDLEITTVGFGAWAIGGGSWAYGRGPQDDEGSIAAIRHAVDGDINWIDTFELIGSARAVP